MAIPRRLSFSDDEGTRHSISQNELLGWGACVVLGEPGMGKTTLMKWLSSELQAECHRAVSALEEPDWGQLALSGKPVLIDGFDEVLARNDGDILARIAPRLRNAGRPQFIIACRAREWLRTTADAIARWYGAPPTEFDLEPIHFEEAVQYAQEICPKSVNVLEELGRLREEGLGGLLENGLTLDIVIRLLGRGEALPRNRKELFEQACSRLWFEHAQEHRDSALSKLSTEDALDAAGAMSAALLFSGAPAAAIGTPSFKAGDLLVADVASLPIAAAAAAVVGSKLFRSAGPDRVEPVHRVLQEFLAARWLCRAAPTGRAKKRVARYLRSGGGNPSSLRGLHAWLASLSPEMAQELINADPFGVLRYGEVGNLDDASATYLLDQLVELSRKNPDFRRWDSSTSHSASGLVRPNLLGRIEALINDTDTSWQLRWLLIEALSGSLIQPSAAEILSAIIRSPERIFREREDAIVALLPHRVPEFWRDVAAELRDFGDENSTRLAISIIEHLNCEVDPELLVTAVLSDIGCLVCPLPKHDDGRTNTIHVYSSLADRLSDHLLVPVLEEAVRSCELVQSADNWPKWEWADFCERLLIRVVEKLNKTPQETGQLWNWLGLLRINRWYLSLAPERRAALSQSLATVRHSLQAHAAFEAEGFGVDWFWLSEMETRCVGFQADDVLDFVATHLQKPSNEPRKQEVWRIMMRATRGQDPSLDARIRVAGRPFAEGNGDLLAYLNAVENPQPEDWEIEEQERRARYEREQSQKFERHRAFYAEHSNEVAAGEFDFITAPAQAYLRMFHDVQGETPEQRLVTWLGSDLTLTAMSGLEASLWRNDLPSPQEVAEKLAGKTYPLRCISLVAGAAERWLSGRPLSDIPFSVLATILHFTLFWDGNLQMAGLRGFLDALEAEVNFSESMRRDFALDHVGPQIVRGAEQVNFLHKLTHDERWRSTGLDLAETWLVDADDVHDGAATTLLQHFVRHADRNRIEAVVESRLQRGLPEDGRGAARWRTLATILGDSRATPRNGAQEPEFEPIEHLASVLGPALSNSDLDPPVDLISSIFGHFRAATPFIDLPGRRRHSEEAYQASGFLRSLLGWLAGRTDETALEALGLHAGAEKDGWSPTIRLLHQEQAQKRADEAFAGISTLALAAMLTDGPPASVEDLREIVLDILQGEQQRLRGAETDPVRLFWTDNQQPRVENECRDRLAELLGPRLEPFEIRLMTEADMPQAKRVDLGFATGQLQLPIEIKGQWHPKLWSAATGQLDRQYLADWRSQGKGMYLVLWFGRGVGNGRRLQPHPRTRVVPDSPLQLLEMLEAEIPESRRDAIEVVVLDLTLPA